MDKYTLLIVPIFVLIICIIYFDLIPYFRRKKLPKYDDDTFCTADIFQSNDVPNDFIILWRRKFGEICSVNNQIISPHMNLDDIAYISSPVRDT